MHRMGMNVWTPIAVEGSTEMMMKGNGFGTNWRGLYVTSLLDAHGAWRERANALSEILKLGILCGHYMHKCYRGRYYAKAQNLSRKLREAYDEVLESHDLLLMPTSPIKAPELPPANATRAEMMSPGFDPITNTAPIDCTGHPAMSIPCGMSDGLPVGMMLIAKHYDEMTIYRASHAFEKAADWKSM
jgi:amidase